MRFAAALIAALVAGAAAAPAAAYDLLHPAPDAALRELQPDRPNLTDAPVTVDGGRLVVEFGAFDYSRDHEAGATEVVTLYGETNLRLGLTDRLEINLLFDPYVGHREEDRGLRTIAHGQGDVVFGAKLNLLGADGSGPFGLALKPQVRLPTARRALHLGRTQLSLAAPFTAELPAGFTLSLQPTVFRVRDQEHRHATGGQFAAAIDHDVGPVNAYAELVYENDQTEGPPVEVLDLGVSAPVGRNLVLDTGVGVGLSHSADDVRWLVGLTRRF